MTKRAAGRTKDRTRSSSDPSAVRTTVTQGIAALAVSALGLAVAGSVALTATAQANGATNRTSAVSAAAQPDATRAEPAPRNDQINTDIQAAKGAAERAEQADRKGGTLEAFSRDGEGRASRDTVRAELDAAVEDRVAAKRVASLTDASEEANSESRKAVASARDDAMEAEVEAARREEKRAQEAKKKAEEAARQGGTLPPADQAAPPVDTTVSGDVSGGGGTTPIAKGSYRLGARWGAVGSWSRYHTGQDLPAPIGTPIRAAVDGVVMPATGGGWAGNHVIIRASDGSSTLYAHMSTTSVSAGQTVKAGQQIGAVGMTGRTFGPHLHFEYYKAGVRPGDVYSSSDPYAWMLSKGVQL
ncbi:peptidoglycan DD-metalloendopeptidase family protein [Naumannella cuiyingiana]|uniref:Murein DD-endopeptidase MepM/ murein hydrolase activator NlpD n=1 Tax=Naumannella cuiyingiana TaxID=1347891 RepID=A0A7Z0IK81_9ACTN|nr:murein DD-endopeptidase MepM/ murein hydrolase activator NlpD [Naumannella cuiyingiana]